MYHTFFTMILKLGEVLAKTLGFYQVPELGNWSFKKNVDQMTNGNLDQQMAYTIRWSPIKSAVTIQERLQNV